MRKETPEMPVATTVKIELQPSGTDPQHSSPFGWDLSFAAVVMAGSVDDSVSWG
jgi:hypothetical protein